MTTIISELERALDALRSEEEQRKYKARRRALEASERITKETADFLVDSGVFEAFNEGEEAS